MGWCSGTEIFDNVAKFVLSTDKPDQEKIEILRVLAEAMENQDWDCQDDSDYRTHPIIKQVFRELHPNWEET